jgi:uncharacterized membrane protein (Fun14 family)
MENQDILSANELGLRFGVPFLLGYAVGKIIRKLLSFAVLMVGLVVLTLFGIEYFGLIQISDLQMISKGGGVLKAFDEFIPYIIERLSRFPAQGISATGGFYVGFKDK